MSARILLVEDDENLGFVIRDNLAQRGYKVTHAADGDAGEQAYLQGEFDLCILDVMLPKKDGFSLAQAIRKANGNIPILFLTAKTMLEDKISAFQLGGDDYLTKPFSMEELLLRIEVFLRRTHYSAQSGDRIYPMGAYQFDCHNLTLQHSKGTKNLTQKEAELLKLLCSNQGRILKREEILKKVWGDDDYFMGRSMDVFISKLRKYLKDDSSIQIVNYHGVGYKLSVEG